ncbi:MAG: phytanoyl-CoA dioxygenase family protein, partial [Stellaceae bacterium]
MTAPVATGYNTQLNELTAAERRVRRGGKPVKLTPEQIRQFEEEGYFFLPGCFSDEEVAVLRDEAEEIYRSGRPEVWREKTGAPRTAFAAHTYNEAFRLLGTHPRLVEPLEQVFGEGVYT